MQTRSRVRCAMHFGCLLAFVWLACALPPLHAATPPATAGGDPPARVARVSWLAGEASLLPAGGEQWRDLAINRPLVRGDRLATAAGARVELQLGDAVAHLDGATDVGLLALGEWQTQLALTRGTVELNVHTLPDGQTYEIDTPQVAVVIDRPARVRVDVGEDGVSVVTVHRGSAVVYGDAGARRVVETGQRYRFAGSTLADVRALGWNTDAFDRWCRSREQRYADADSRRYVAEGTIGYRDLDHYGQWRDATGYGTVWFPNHVGPGWAPYRQGRWTWIAPWGWTWMSNEPWGFAPFHYGRWVTIGGRWGWLPGPVGVRAVYAPALVRFFGGSGWHVSVGLTYGSVPVGWYPLGPGMIYNPWYHAGWNYYARVNRCDVRFRHGHRHQRIRDAYNLWRKPRRVRRMRFPGRPPHGITVVSRRTLAEGHAVAAARVHVADTHLRDAPLRMHGLDIDRHPLRDATWRPARRVGKIRQPVVALHRPPSVHARVRHEQTGADHAPRPPHRVRLLTPAAQAYGQRTPRPLPKRVVERALPRPVARTPERSTHAAVAHAKRVSPVRKPLAPMRKPDRQAHATLPRVKRLHRALPSRPTMSDSVTSLPDVRRVQPVRRESKPSPRTNTLSAARPRSWNRERTEAPRVVRSPRRFEARPEPRPTVHSRRRFPSARPQARPAVRSPRRAAPRPAPPPRRHAPAPRPVHRAAKVHAAPTPVSHKTSSSQSHGKRKGKPPPISW